MKYYRYVYLHSKEGNTGE